MADCIVIAKLKQQKKLALKPNMILERFIQPYFSKKLTQKAVKA
jgi:hypothetical protein